MFQVQHEIRGRARFNRKQKRKLLDENWTENFVTPKAITFSPSSIREIVKDKSRSDLLISRFVTFIRNNPRFAEGGQDGMDFRGRSHSQNVTNFLRELLNKTRAAFLQNRKEDEKEIIILSPPRSPSTHSDADVSTDGSSGDLEASSSSLNSETNRLCEFRPIPLTTDALSELVEEVMLSRFFYLSPFERALDMITLLFIAKIKCSTLAEWGVSV